MVLLPPEIEQIGYELKVRAYRAEHLPKMDTRMCLIIIIIIIIILLCFV